jgi:hypothetical protein
MHSAGLTPLKVDKKHKKEWEKYARAMRMKKVADEKAARDA